DAADRLLHVGVCDAKNAMCYCLGRLAERKGELGQRCRGAVFIQAHAAAQEVLDTNPPQGEVGIGDGGLIPSTVTGRSRIGAGALRADRECSTPVAISQAAAAGADALNVQGGKTDRAAAD